MYDMLRLLGRMKKHQKNGKEEVVNVRMTTDQKKTLVEMAEREGLGLSTWLLRTGLVTAQAQKEKERAPR